jgi:hypothetical protein
LTALDGNSRESVLFIGTQFSILYTIELTYCSSGRHKWHTPTNKLELGSIVCKQFCIDLHASRCLNKHLTGAPSSYIPLLVLGPAPHDLRVHKPTIRETRMTRVVNGVRHEPSAVCARSALAGQLRKLRRTQALLRKHTHPLPGAFTVEGAPAASRFPPAT